MKYLYPLFVGIMSVVAWFTGEIVTFIMLGFILMALNNILDVLKAIYKKLDNKKLDQK